MWTDDISFCPIEKCRRKTCRRNQQNIRDRTIPHSYFVERPPDCPYRKKQDDFYHIRKKAVTTIPDREKVIKGFEICDNNEDGIVCKNCPYKEDKWNGAWEDETGKTCFQTLHADVLALLKKQDERIKELELEKGWDESPDMMGKW